MKDVPVSVIIPTLNEEHYLPILLNSLADTGEPLEVIVVDGNSVDDTAGVVDRLTSRFTGKSSLQLLEATERGISKQRNAGARAASSETILFLDADVRVPRDAYRMLLQHFEKEEYDVVTGLLHPDSPDIRGSLIFLLGRIFQRAMLFMGEAYFAGSLLLTKRKFFFEVGAFDESLSVGEDIDFSLRASQKGRCGMVAVYVPVSMRRFKKYGYWRVFTQWFFAIVQRVMRLKSRTNSDSYEFGFHDKVLK